MTPAEAGLLQAISDHLAPSWDQRDTFGEAAYHYAAADVQKAIAALQGRGWDPAGVAEFTAILTGTTGQAHAGEPVPNHTDNAGHVLGAFTGQLPGGFVPGECISCHGHVDAGGTFHPAEVA